jgi:type IV pilus assembly protein PilB
MAKGGYAMHEVNEKDFSEVISLIIKEGFVTEEKVSYAVRVLSKLAVSKPLLHVLKELNYVTDNQIKEALRANPVSLPIGSLLVELGLISEANMQAALAIQKESKPKRKIEEILVSQQYIDGYHSPCK